MDSAVPSKISCGKLRAAIPASAGSPKATKAQVTRMVTAVKGKTYRSLPSKVGTMLLDLPTVRSHSSTTSLASVSKLDRSGNRMRRGTLPKREEISVSRILARNNSPPALSVTTNSPTSRRIWASMASDVPPERYLPAITSLILPSLCRRPLQVHPRERKRHRPSRRQRSRDRRPKRMCNRCGNEHYGP